MEDYDYFKGMEAQIYHRDFSEENMNELEALFDRFQGEGTARYFIQLAGCVEMTDLAKVAELAAVLGDVEVTLETAYDETAHTKNITIWRTQV